MVQGSIPIILVSAILLFLNFNLEFVKIFKINSFELFSFHQNYYSQYYLIFFKFQIIEKNLKNLIIYNYSYENLLSFNY